MTDATKCLRGPTCLYASAGWCPICEPATESRWAIIDNRRVCIDCGNLEADCQCCTCGHAKDEHHPCGSCEHECPCLNYSAAESTPRRREARDG